MSDQLKTYDIQPDAVDHAGRCRIFEPGIGWVERAVVDAREILSAPGSTARLLDDEGRRSVCAEHCRAGESVAFNRPTEWRLVGPDDEGE